MNVVPIRDHHRGEDSLGEHDRATGTLLWIGDPSPPELQPAYQHCVQHAAQIALRDDALEAFSRPAADVQWIVVARGNRAPLSKTAFQSLALRYPNACSIDLLGPLCEGVRASSHSNSTRVAWHRWDQIVPHWFMNPSREGAPAPQVVSSVAVIAASFATAQTYLDLAASTGVAAVWCQSPDAMRVRNVDAVWWDDSVAQATDAQVWRERLRQFDSATKSICHVWITHTAWLDQQRLAMQGGIDTVITKPYRIDALVGTLNANQITASKNQAA
jgi:hypothetical protein